MKTANKTRHTIAALCAWALTTTLFVACGTKEYKVPAESTHTDSEAMLYPDYTNTVVPPNIAPLNFMLRDSLATGVVVQLRGEKGGELVAGAGKDLKVEMDTTEWRRLLGDNRGADIQAIVYAKREGGWVKYNPYTLTVAEEEIDSYLSYRLIEPGYELYRQLGIYQRNLTNWDEQPIYENNRTYEDANNHCINCHNYQNYSTENMLFHVRANHGGTMIVQGGQAKKVQIKGDSILTSGVYPSWHPTLPLVALSTNKTGQAFYLNGRDKIEVMDEASDLLLYDVEQDRVQLVLNADTLLETFPAWNPTGDYLYYCVAREPFPEQDWGKGEQARKIMTYYDLMHYDIRRLPFDAETRTFGPSEPVGGPGIAESERQLPAREPRRALSAVGTGRVRTVPHLAQVIGPVGERPADRQHLCPHRGQQPRRGELSHVELQRTVDRVQFAKDGRQLHSPLHCLL